MLRHRQASTELLDSKQSAWQLAAIQLSGWTSLPILAASVLVLRENSLLGAVFTIIVGNAILWFIRLGILSMSYTKRQSTLDIARDYLGNLGGYFIAILLLATTLFWFIAQTTTGSHSITTLLPIHEDPNIDQFTQVSVVLGVISTLFCMGGIVSLRKLSSWALPILILVFFLILLALPTLTPPTNNLPLSLSGLTLILATNLGITTDLPTFFRHSRSWPTSVKALTIVQLVSLALGLMSLYLGAIVIDGFEINHEAIRSSGSQFLRFSLIGFISLSLICANVANVYSASVGWELVAPRALVGRKEYFILGLGLTTIFVLVSGLFSLELCLEISDNSLVMLCIVLLFGFIISQRKKQLPDFFEKQTYFIAWLLSSLINTFQFLRLLPQAPTLLIGTSVILLVIGSSFLTRRFLAKK